MGTRRIDDSVATRRRLLRAVGASAIVTGVAGCSASTDDEGASDDGGDESPDSDGDADETDGADADPPSHGACELGDPDDDCEQETLDSHVTEDTTLGEDCDRVVVTNYVEVDEGATLTIEPRTEVRFTEDAGIRVRTDSALHAEGTCEDPIRFTGDESTRGHWVGVVFDRTNQPENVLRHVTVEYAGARIPNAALRQRTERANLYVDDSRVTIDRCTFHECDDFGISLLGGDTSVDSFDENLVTDNGAAVYASARTAHHLSETSSFAGNDDDRVRVGGYDIAEEMDVTWDALDARYVLTEYVEVEGELAIAPGATVSFGEDAYIHVKDGGRLNANGMDPETEEVDEITFTSEDERPGHWKGIFFDRANQSENVLRYATIEYAGGDPPNSTLRFSSGPANVVVHSSRATIADCTIRESTAWGVSISGSVPNTTIESFENNTIVDNDGPVRIRSELVHFLSDTSVYAGNAKEYVYVAAGTGSKVEAARTWDALDVRYRIDDVVQVEDEGSLTIEPGATLSFEQDGALYMYDGGTLTADGEDGEITITAEEEIPGYWNGVVFDKSMRTSNVLRNVVVEYGGKDLWTASVRSRAEPANVVLLRDSAVTVEDSVIRHSAGHGIHVGSQSLTHSNNEFENIADRNVND